MKILKTYVKRNNPPLFSIHIIFPFYKYKFSTLNLQCVIIIISQWKPFSPIVIIKKKKWQHQQQQPSSSSALRAAEINDYTKSLTELRRNE